MKSTFELPDALAREAKELARAQSTTVRDLVVTGLRREIDRRTSDRSRPDFVFPTADGEGLRVDPGEAIRIASAETA
ncbi:hypothetical protein BCF74_10274 [Knoellia remsis]|uniref:VapB protein of antitoxin of type II toxin-antitoxin system n=1 Tax=Knoellia remsis TaxID=407159 RepID=A0A2T0UZ95_9MICO|nr:hypothetical protein [Knoellia remsis]PRY63242.1 hypothetical protein BCF74_10274 [Knoellia remsis]